MYSKKYIALLLSIFKWIFSTKFLNDISQVIRYYYSGVPEILFYCSNKIHYEWIASTISEVKNKHTCVLVISDNNLLNDIEDGFKIYRISIYGIRLLRSKMVISSSTGGNFPVLSKHMAPFRVHMPHSLVSLHLAYPLNAFKNFNIIFCCGAYHKQEIRKLDGTYSSHSMTETKDIGYGKLDTLKKKYKSRFGKVHQKNSKKEILIAPSWGEGNVFQENSIEIIDRILSNNYKVTLRPHIGSYSSKYFINVEEYYKDNKYVQIENPYNESNSLYTADLIITDYSGIALEYIYLRERPALFLDGPIKCNNKEWKKLNIMPIEISLRKELGKICSVNADEICREVDNILGSVYTYKKKITMLREKYLFNYGKCSVAAKEAIAEILKIN